MIVGSTLEISFEIIPKDRFVFQPQLYIQNNNFEIEVAKKKYSAKLEFKPLHDPKNILLKK